MANKIRYGITKMIDGGVIEEGLQWREDTFEDAIAAIRAKGRPTCGVFFYKDIRDNIGHTVLSSEMEATREEFETAPGRYGVCYYSFNNTWRFE